MKIPESKFADLTRPSHPLRQATHGKLEKGTETAKDLARKQLSIHSYTVDGSEIRRNSSSIIMEVENSALKDEGLRLQKLRFGTHFPWLRFRESTIF